MKTVGYRRTWLCAVLAPLLAACTHAGMDTPTDHWENVGTVAVVAARDGDAYLTASCFNGATLALMSTAEVKGQPEARTLALGFDGSAPARQKWTSRDYALPRWGFETEKSEGTDFWRILAQLRVNREAEAIVEEAGREVLHVHFSLVGAGDALAKAYKNCPP